MDITGIAPEEMALLTKQFIEKKNVNDRVSIRLRMKAVLDYLSTDTEFPANPLIKKDESKSPARDAAMYAAPNQQGQGYAGNAVNTVWPLAAGAEPIPGAQRMENADILG
jgi:hypothetical protein